MNRRALAIGTVILVIVGVFAAVFISQRVSQNATVAPGEKTLKVGDVAPRIQVSSTDGFFDSAEVHQPILLEVFATWCPHCRRATVTLNQLYKNYLGRIKIMAVDGSEFADEMQTIPESQANVVQFAQDFKIQYPVAYDHDLTVARDYYYHGFPTIVVIDKNGRVASISSGESTEDDLRKRINRTL